MVPFVLVPFILVKNIKKRLFACLHFHYPGNGQTNWQIFLLFGFVGFGPGKLTKNADRHFNFLKHPKCIGFGIFVLSFSNNISNTDGECCNYIFD